MRKLRTIICTLLIMTVVLMPCAGYAATKTIPRPAVTVKVVEDDFIKVSWKKSTGAAKYAVYRATSKNGTYKKLITTTKRYYNDMKAKNKTTYYYKVKAISKSGKASKYSYVKSGRINFNGKITSDKDTYYVSVGESIEIPIYASGTDDYMTVNYDDDYLEVDSFMNQGIQFMRVTPIDGTIPIMDCVLALRFGNHTRHYTKNITICINTYTKPYDFMDSNVPDFGKGFLVKPYFRSIDSEKFAEAYLYSDIRKMIPVDMALDYYIEELEKCGFEEYYLPVIPGSQPIDNIRWFKNSDGYVVAISREAKGVMIMVT